MRTIRYFGLGLVCAGLALIGCANQPSARVCANGIVCPAGTTCAAVQEVCIVGSCGNGLVDPGEQCDDGNIVDGDGCSHNCAKEVCGDGKQDPGEQCDDGNLTDGDGCSRNCTSEKCGNGIKDFGEVCDDGNTEYGDGCAGDCKSDETCGNGITDIKNGKPGIKEICDDGGKPGGCNDDCQGGTGCGDGSIDKDAMGNPLEQCDDGNGDDFDDCLSSHLDTATNCKIAKCGDGVVQTKGSRIEDCDPGANGVALETAGCNIDCSFARCGDGKVNPKNTAFPATSVGEQCDDGNLINGDGCDTNCTIPVCGNHIIDPGEQCDDGNLVDNDGCDHNCKLPLCGNGVINPGAPLLEECDDGNLVDNDGCDRNCKVTRCGNGIMTGTEQCDDGNTAPGDGCSPDCHREECGNGILDPNEACDDGNSSDDDDCLSSATTTETRCKLARCGDGKIDGVIVNGVAREDCDDGALNGTPASSCSATCRVVTCGNGVKEQGEECDDGNASDEDDCLSSATSPETRCKLARCGDSKIDKVTLNGLARETCDDGTLNGASGDRCSATCHTVKCGNGVIDQDETCDDGDGNNGSGKRCNELCRFNVCGDGNAAGAEQCDEGTVVAGVANPRDTLGCDRDCSFSVCGDGYTNSAAHEDCDDGALNGTTQSTCDSFCHLAACGNGLIDTGEQCDPGTGVATETTPVPDGELCDGDCTAVVCGDGRTNQAAHETCDDGRNNGDPCDYADQTCERCNSTCNGTVHPGGPFCGDGRKDVGHEFCDSGTRNGSKCSYGDVACLQGDTSNICADDCASFLSNLPTPNGPFCGDGLAQSEFNEQCDPGTGLTPTDSPTCDKDCSLALCGDGYRNTAGTEQCDDGNTDACGTCSASCGASVIPTAAIGRINTVAGNLLNNNETFTLIDGFHPAKVFEYVKDGTLKDSTHVLIKLAADGSDAADVVRGLTIDAINGVDALDLRAADGSGLSGGTLGTVQLTNRHLSALGNQSIAETVDEATFTVAAMTGGLAGDCAIGLGCASSADCATNVCDATTHRCVVPPPPPPLAQFGPELRKARATQKR